MKLPEKVVYKGERMKRDVLDPPFNQKFWTQAMAWVDEDGGLCTGVFLFDDQSVAVQCYEGSSVLSDDVILQYREFLLLEAMTRIGYVPGLAQILSEEFEAKIGSDAAAEVITLAKLCASGFHFANEPEARSRLQAFFATEIGGADRLATILKSVPADLPWLIGLLKRFEANIELGYITDAAEHGELEFTAELEAEGVLSPRKRAEKKARRAEVLAPLQPHIDAFLASIAHARHEGCNMIRLIEAGALSAYDHGIDALDIQLGLGIIAAVISGVRDKVVQSLRDDIIGMFMGRGKPVIPNIQQLEHDAIGHAATCLASQFTDRKMFGRKALYEGLLREALDQVKEGPVVKDDV